MTSRASDLTPSVPLAPGALVGGKYRVERLLGRGAMGVVAAARHEELDLPVAIKAVFPERVERSEAIARFFREARAAARLESDHVARVTDVGILDDGSPYMVMELLTGVDLGELLLREGPLPIRAAVDAIVEAIDAVSEAHARGIVHRDLKPGNLFRASRTDGSWRVKVLDFGISKAIDGSAGMSLTKSDSIVGSPLYMSPEQVLSSKEVDARADVWSLGVVLYELLTGVRPFGGDTMGAVLNSVLTATIPSPRAARADLPPELEAAILRCLERDLTRRYRTVAELAGELAPFASPHARELAERALLAQRGAESTIRPPAFDVPPATERMVGTVTDGEAPRSAIRTVASSPSDEAIGRGSQVGASTAAARRPPAASRATLVITILALLAGGAVGWAARGLASPPAGAEAR